MGIFYAIKAIKEKKEIKLQCLTCGFPYNYNGEVIDLDIYLKCKCGCVNYIVPLEDKNKQSDKITKLEEVEKEDESIDTINNMKNINIINNYYKIDNSILKYK